MAFTRIDWVAGHCQLLRSISAEFKARCLEAVASGSVDASSCVVPVPGRIDTAIATSYLARKYPPRVQPTSGFARFRPDLSLWGRAATPDTG